MAVRREQSSLSWSIVEAKAHLDEVIGEIDDVGPQSIVKNRDELAIVVSAHQWGDRQRRRGTLVEFLDNSPLRGLDIDIERHPDTREREINL